jgi:phage terminase small subunit
MQDIEPTMEDLQQVLTDEELDKKLSKLSLKQMRFIDEYMIDGNATQAALRAGYTKTSAYNSSRKLLRRSEVASELGRRYSKLHNSRILSSEEILEMYSAIAKGEVQDQFGLDASLSDRLKALDALAKRQIDIPAKLDANAPTELNVNIIRHGSDNA